MTEINPDRTTGTITIDVFAQSNGQYLCQISSSLSDRPDDTINFYGQTKEHAIAIALEKLASRYRQQAEDSHSLARMEEHASLIFTRSLIDGFCLPLFAPEPTIG